MSATRGFRLLELPIILGIIVGMAYMIYVVAIYLGPLILYPSYADYAPAELVLNRFDLPGEKWSHDFAVSPTGKQLVAVGSERIYWIANWDAKDHARTETHGLDVGDKVYAAAYSGDGTKVAFFIEEHEKHPRATRIEIYDSRTQQLVSKGPAPPDHWIFNLLISHDGKALLTNSDGGVNLWDTSTGQLLRTLKITEGPGWINLTSHDRLVKISRDDDYKELTVHQSEESFRDTKLVSSIKAPAGTEFKPPPLLSVDGSLLAIGVHPTFQVNVYRVSDGELVAKLERHFHAVCYAFSPSGKILAISYSDDTVTLWRTDSGKELYTLRGLPVYPIRFLAFGPDDKRLISRDAKATVVWDISQFVD